MTSSHLAHKAFRPCEYFGHTALNWIIAFLAGRSQVCKTSDGRFSDPQPITSSIVQGSGIGPTLWLIMKSDLHPLSDANVIFKYADDTNLLVPENTDCTLADEFSHIKRWADTNGLIINFDKTKKLFLDRQHVTRHDLPQSLAGIEQVLTVRLLGVIFQSSLSFAAHVDYVLKVCHQKFCRPDCGLREKR